MQLIAVFLLFEARWLAHVEFLSYFDDVLGRVLEQSELADSVEVAHFHLKLICEQEKLAAEQIKSNSCFFKEVLLNGSYIFLELKHSESANVLDELDEEAVDLRQVAELLQYNLSSSPAWRKHIQKLHEENFELLSGEWKGDAEGIDLSI